MNKVLKSLVITGPSGAGKTSLVKKLLGEYPKYFSLSVSHTTRLPRPNEKSGVDYYFVSLKEFQDKISKNDFIEHENVHGNMYGTSKMEIDRLISLNKVPLLDIDVKGAIYVHQGGILKDSNFFLIAPPSPEILEKRLRGRKTETEADLKRRLENSREELRKAHDSGIFPKENTIVNDVFDVAWSDFIRRLKELYPIS